MFFHLSTPGTAIRERRCCCCCALLSEAEGRRLPPPKRKPLSDRPCPRVLVAPYDGARLVVLLVRFLKDMDRRGSS